MNIMFLAIYPIVPSVGGVQRVTNTLALELQKRGHSVIFVTYSRKHLMNYKGFAAPQYYVEIQNRQEADIKKDIANIIAKHHVEIVVNQNYNLSFVSYLPKDVKIISVCHVQPFMEDNVTRQRIKNYVVNNYKQFIFKWLCFVFPFINRQLSQRAQCKETLRVFDFSDKICYISSHFFNRVLKHLPNLPVDKLVAINNPNTYPVNNVDFRGKDNLIIWVGRIEVGKNPMDFIRMWEKMAPKFQNWRSVIIGEGGDMQKCVRYVKEHAVANVEFVGRIENILEYYIKAKFLVVTSWSESWCMAITEAMANGCIPIVYDTFETLRDMVDDKENGFIVKPKVDALCSSLENCIQMDDDSLCDISSRARTTVAKFSVENTADRWENLFKTLI